MINFLILLVLSLGMGKPAFPMELGDENPLLYPKQVIFCLNSNGYCTFHDLDQLSQTSKSNHNSIMAYFDESIPKVVEFFKGFSQMIQILVSDQDKIWKEEIWALSQEIFNIFQEPIEPLVPDHRKTRHDTIWALSKKWVTFDSFSQLWILNYAINYLTYSLQTSSRKNIDPGFHEWIFFIRLFQGSKINFNADLFINNVTDTYLLSLDSTSDYANHAERQVRQQYRGSLVGANPRSIIKHIQIINFETHKDIRNLFIDNELSFLFLYRSEQRVLCDKFEEFSQLFISENMELVTHTLLELGCWFNILLMRRAESSLKLIIQTLALAPNKMCSWYKCARYFIETFDSWALRGLFDTDQEAKENLETIKGILMLDCIIDQCIEREGPKEKSCLIQSLDMKQPDKNERTRKISLL